MYKSESFLLFLLLLLLLFLFLLPFLLLPFLLHSLDAVFNGDKLGAYPVTHFCICLEYPEDYQLDDFGDYQLFHGVLGDALKFPELFVVQCYGQVEFFAILCEFFKMLAKITHLSECQSIWVSIKIPLQVPHRVAFASEACPCNRYTAAFLGAASRQR